MAGFAPRPNLPPEAVQSLSGLPPEVLQKLDQARAGAGVPTSGGDGGILQFLMDFLSNPNSPIGQVLNPGANPGFGIAGPGGPGLPPPNPLGAISGGGPPGATPDPSQVRSTPIDALVRSMHGPGLAGDAAAGVQNFEGGGRRLPPGAAGAAMGSNADIANVIKAMTAAGEGSEGEPASDGVPVTPGLVERPGAGGAAGRLPRAGGQYGTRKIRPGETLSGIAGGSGPKRLGGLRGANPSITDPNKIRAGDTINVPVTNVTRAKSSSGKKKAIGSKADIQNRAMAHAKVQKKSYSAPAKRAGSMYGGRH